MDFHIKNRDGPARIGEFILQDEKITTPNIFFVDNNRFSAPSYSDLLISNVKKDREKPVLEISESLLSPSNKLNSNELEVSNYLFFPKDLPDKYHLKAMKYYKKTQTCYILPANKNIIEQAVKGNPASMYIVGNVSQLYNNPKQFVEFFIYLKENLEYDKNIYTPCIGKPSNIALLTYLGIDFFDNIYAIHSARNNILLFTENEYSKDELEETHCSCPVCNGIKTFDKMKFQHILEHNNYMINNEIKHVRNAIRKGILRELVELRVKSSAHMTALLRNLDNQYDFLEKWTSVHTDKKVLANSLESMFRPEIVRFQKRLIERYKKPEFTKILLLLPCSAKKPYSFSKTHNFFKKSINQTSNPEIIHEVIVTSPLGLVPRDLELIFPAQQYDIPVTGKWYEDEKKMIRTLLKKYLENNHYDKIIMHLPSEITCFLTDQVKKPQITCLNDKTTSDESLEKLYETLEENVSEYKKINTQIRKREDLKSLLSYQFNITTAEKIINNAIIKGKYPFYKIFEKNKQLGMITRDRGLISLTLDGAKILQKSNIYWVKIYNDFKLKGSVLAPGIKDADFNIRIGDEVIIIQDKKLVGVGIAMMNGEEMKQLNYGMAVKTRHTT